MFIFHCSGLESGKIPNVPPSWVAVEALERTLKKELSDTAEELLLHVLFGIKEFQFLMSDFELGIQRCFNLALEALPPPLPPRVDAELPPMEAEAPPMEADAPPMDEPPRVDAEARLVEA